MKKVVVSELKDDTFYAVIWLERDGKACTIDSRPSDALALALRHDCPIFVDDRVLQTSRSSSNVSEKVNNEELRKWLENLNDEDLGRYKCSQSICTTHRCDYLVAQPHLSKNKPSSRLNVAYFHLSPVFPTDDFYSAHPQRPDRINRLRARTNPIDSCCLWVDGGKSILLPTAAYPMWRVSRTRQAAAYIPTFTQVGTMFGMGFFVPFGDMVERRRLIVRGMRRSIAHAASLCLWAPSFLWLAIASLCLGLTCIVPHLVLPFAAQIARPTLRPAY